MIDHIVRDPLRAFQVIPSRERFELAELMFDDLIHWRFWKIGRVAQMFGLPATTIRAWIRVGKIGYFKLGPMIRIPTCEVERLFRVLRREGLLYQADEDKTWKPSC